MNKEMYDGDDGIEKLAYESPKIVSIELLADEVLAVGCKSTPGEINSGNPVCGIAQGCATLGS